MRKLAILLLIALSIFAFASCAQEPEHEHTWNEGEITTPATCTTEGVKTYTCTGCGETKTEAVAAAHTLAFVEKVEETCETDGVKAHYHCSACNKDFEDEKGTVELTDLVIAKHHTFSTDWSTNSSKHWHTATCEHDVTSDEGNHTYDDGVITTEPTCTTTGTKTYTCTVCGYSYAQYPPIAALGHDLTEVAEVAATCTADGTKAHYHCSRCGKDFDAFGVELTDLTIHAGHTWDSGVQDGLGNITFECQACHKTVTEAIPEYSIGDVGPGGGFIFYDCDADNSSGNADGLTSAGCGWRYMEISTTNITNVAYAVVYSTKDPTDKTNSYDGKYMISDPFVTSDALGAGKENTEAFIQALLNGYLYVDRQGQRVQPDKCPFYIAETSDQGGKTDWFIPSVGELAAAASAGFTFANAGYGVWSSTREAEDVWYNRTMKSGASSDSNQGPNSLWYMVRRFIVVDPDHEHTWDAGTDNGNGKIVYKCTVGKETKTEYKTYAIGATGPAGGLIFYDCDADNESGNADGLTSAECGWRYLEVAPADITGTIRFGYYRTTGGNLFVNGTGTYSETDCTGTAIGTGKTNTEKLVAAMGSEAYESSSGDTKISVYAAKACADYVNGDFDDWFLPSKDELNLVYVNLKAAGIASFAKGYYWSSSESDSNADYSWEQFFDDSNPYLQAGTKATTTRYNSYCVRPIRAF